MDHCIAGSRSKQRYSNLANTVLTRGPAPSAKVNSQAAVCTPTIRTVAASVNRADDRCQRGVDASALLGIDHRTEYLEETRILHTADDVLPTVCAEHRRVDRLRLAVVEVLACHLREVVGVALGLHLHDAVHRAHQADEFADSLVALRGVEPQFA